MTSTELNSDGLDLLARQDDVLRRELVKAVKKVSQVLDDSDSLRRLVRDLQGVLQRHARGARVAGDGE